MGFEKAGRRDHMFIGYARVSTDEQSLDLTVDEGADRPERVVEALL